MDTGKQASELLSEWLRYAPYHPLIYCPLNNVRFWGWEFKYDESIACLRRGGIIPRKGKNVRKVPDPVTPTSAQPEEHELLDGEQDEGDEAMPDGSADADWSRDLMCVADPFIVGKVRIFTSSRRFFVQCQPLSELR